MHVCAHTWSCAINKAMDGLMAKLTYANSFSSGSKTAYGRSQQDKDVHLNKQVGTLGERKYKPFFYCVRYVFYHYPDLSSEWKYCTATCHDTAVLDFTHHLSKVWPYTWRETFEVIRHFFTSQYYNYQSKSIGNLVINQSDIAYN